MKFHHNQKVKIISGYYNTYKGFIVEQRLRQVKNNDNTITNLIEYKVNILIKNEEKPIIEWLQEKDLKVSLF